MSSLYSYWLLKEKKRQIEKVTLRTTQLLPFAVAQSLALQGFSLSFDCLKIKTKTHKKKCKKG